MDAARPPLSDELRQALDQEPARAIAEYLAERLDCDDGLTMIELVYENGTFVRGFLKRGPVNVTELDLLGRAVPSSRS